MAAVAPALDPLEHPPEVDRALAGAKVILVSTVVVGHTHLAAAPEIHGVEEAVDALGNEMRMVDRERPAEVRRLDTTEVLTTLLEIVGEVTDLGVLRLPVEVLQEQVRARPLGVRRRALKALEA